ncbi:MAG: hypothetical protein HQL14_06800 [Candidatus Omnitrophica bacterium]|nr:hypothetical protein [Candidatus Omnitrophota bacterium]
MSLRSCVVFNVLFIMLFLVCVDSSKAEPQQKKEIKVQQLMTPVTGLSVSAAKVPADPMKALVDRLDLKMYEAAGGDLSMCRNGWQCLKGAKYIKSWLCAEDACNGTDKTKKGINCFEGVASKYSKAQQDEISVSFCALIESPNTATRQDFIDHLSNPNVTQDILVGATAFLMALKGYEDGCEHHIKDYVGAYGPQWSEKWYTALSGCRILAGVRARQQEEKDYYTWFGVINGVGSCSDIVDGGMREACSAPQAASPLPVSPKPVPASPEVLPDNAK